MLSRKNDKRPRPIELLSPARDLTAAIAAIDHGADAVYIGGPSHGARSAAANSIGDLKKLVDYAHRFGVRIYVTLNTIIYDNELALVEKLIWELYEIGVDALIVQDMAILAMNIPPIQLHASTQCDTRTPQKALMLQNAGFSQIVLARELTLKEIAEIADSVSVPIEVFVHGALCVSYSGDCRASFYAVSRSANRGECAQICRLPYDLIDDKGNTIIHAKHLLSLKDMNRIEHLEEMLDAGVSSFKIEGRLKDTSYVKTVTAAYRQAIDSIIARSDGKYIRSSFGETTLTFKPLLSESFNRGFTNYFLTTPQPTKIASIDSPKSIGKPIGRVKAITRDAIIMDRDIEVNNGDGLGFFTTTGEFNGFRANRVEQRKIYFRRRPPLTPGTEIFRNFDNRREMELSKETAQRKIPVNFTLRRIDNERISVEISTDTISRITFVADIPFQPSRTPQTAIRQKNLSKLGESIYRLNSIADYLSDNEFIAASALSQIRRDATNLIDITIASRHKTGLRHERHHFQFDKQISPRENVANSLARQFYLDHGSQSIAPAVEITKKINTEIPVMECRYCIRRELGACMKTNGTKKLPEKLFLRNNSNRVYRLEFDCNACRMRVYEKK